MQGLKNQDYVLVTKTDHSNDDSKLLLPAVFRDGKGGTVTKV